MGGEGPRERCQLVASGMGETAASLGNLQIFEVLLRKLRESEDKVLRKVKVILMVLQKSDDFLWGRWKGGILAH